MEIGESIHESFFEEIWGISRHPIHRNIVNSINYEIRELVEEGLILGSIGGSVRIGISLYFYNYIINR